MPILDIEVVTRADERLADGLAAALADALGEGTPAEGEALATRVARIAECVARLTGRPAGTVHVILEPPLRGRIAFGGRLST